MRLRACACARGRAWACTTLACTHACTQPCAGRPRAARPADASHWRACGDTWPRPRARTAVLWAARSTHEGVHTNGACEYCTACRRRSAAGCGRQEWCQVAHVRPTRGGGRPGRRLPSPHPGWADGCCLRTVSGTQDRPGLAELVPTMSRRARQLPAAGGAGRTGWLGRHLWSLEVITGKVMQHHSRLWVGLQVPAFDKVQMRRPGDDAGAERTARQGDCRWR